MEIETVPLIPGNGRRNPHLIRSIMMWKENLELIMIVL